MIKKLLGSQLRLNMASGTVTTIINVVAMAFAYPVYLHFLGYETYGVWLVLATVLSFAQLGNLGIDQAVMKLVAEEHGRGDIKGIQQYVTTALMLLCISGAVVLTVILLLRNQIIAAFNLSDENARTVLWLLPYIGILSIYVFIVQVMNSTLSGLGRMDMANYIQSCGRIVSVAIAAMLLYTGRSVESLLIGNMFSYIFVHVASVICIFRIAKIRFLRMSNLDNHRGKRLLSFGSTVFGGSLASMLLGPFNKLMLSRYAGISSIAVYEIAFTGSMQVRGLIEAGLRALMPEISRLDGSKLEYAKNRIIQIYHHAIRLIILFGIPLYGALFVFAPLLLRLWLGNGFVETLPTAFRIMLISVSFLSLVGIPAYYTIMGLGKVRYLLTTSIIGALGNFILVSTYCALTGQLSVIGTSLCVGASFIAPLVYLVYKAHLLLISNVEEITRYPSIKEQL
jgi:O-antigen/teichoic acid export membrane protein